MFKCTLLLVAFLIVELNATTQQQCTETRCRKLNSAAISSSNVDLRLNFNSNTVHNRNVDRMLKPIRRTEIGDIMKNNTERKHHRRYRQQQQQQHHRHQHHHHHHHHKQHRKTETSNSRYYSHRGGSLNPQIQLYSTKREKSNGRADQETKGSKYQVLLQNKEITENSSDHHSPLHQGDGNKLQSMHASWIDADTAITRHQRNQHISGSNYNENNSIPSRRIIKYVVNHPDCAKLADSLISQYKNISAIELYIAVTVCEGVTNPMDSGLGGGSQIVLYSHKLKRGFYINARENAPLNANGLPMSTGTTAQHIGTPSILKGYQFLYRNMKSYGYSHRATVPWSSLFTINQDLANVGFTPSARFINDVYQYKLYTSQLWLFDEVNNNTRNPTLASYLGRIASYGENHQSIYMKGSVDSEFMANDFEEFGSPLTARDMQLYRVRKSNAAYIKCFNYRVYTSRLPGSGILLLFGCKMLEHAVKSYNYVSWSLDDQFIFILRVLHQMQSLQPFLPDVVAEVRFLKHLLREVPIAVRDIKITLTKYFPQYVAQSIGRLKLPIHKIFTSQTDERGTSNVCISDNVIDLCATSTINWKFGSTMYSKYFGFFYNNQLSDFTFHNKMSPNKPKPGGQPLSSISPTIFINDLTDEMEFSFGAAGGSKIIAANYFVMTDYIMQRERFIRHVRDHLNETTDLYLNQFKYDCYNAEKKSRCTFALIPMSNNVMTNLVCENTLPISFSTYLYKLNNNKIAYKRETGYSSVTTLTKFTDGCYDYRRGGESAIHYV